MITKLLYGLLSVIGGMVVTGLAVTGLVLASQSRTIKEAEPAKAPAKVLSDALKFKITKTQLDMSKMQRDFSACQARPWGQEFGAFQAALQAEVDEAFKETGMSKDAFDLDTDKLEFVAKAKVAEPKK
jgi:hypothetical protein